MLGKVPRGFSSIFRLLPGQEGGGQCPLPCPAREVCIAGDSAPGRGHTHQRPFVIRQCPLPLPANLSVLLTLPCPGALSLSFHLLPGRTCPQALACSLPFGKKRKNPRPSMRCSLNKHRTLHLLSPCLSFLLSPCLSFLLSPCLSFLPSPCLSFLPSLCLSFLPSACFSFLLSPSPHTPPRQAKKSP